MVDTFVLNEVVLLEEDEKFVQTMDTRLYSTDFDAEVKIAADRKTDYSANLEDQEFEKLDQPRRLLSKLLV
jgi:hypothetical protein